MGTPGEGEGWGAKAIKHAGRSNQEEAKETVPSLLITRSIRRCS